VPLRGRHVDRAQGGHAAGWRVASAEVAVEGEVQRRVGAVVLGVGERPPRRPTTTRSSGGAPKLSIEVLPRLARQVFGVDVGAAGVVPAARAPPRPRRSCGRGRCRGPDSGRGQGTSGSPAGSSGSTRRRRRRWSRRQLVLCDLERVGRDGRLLCRLDARLAA
jgi:hypothetical protein